MPRRTKAEMEGIRKAIVEALRKDKPMTVRQVFYRLVVEGVVPKVEGRGYRTVARELRKMRRSGRVPYAWIVDSSRTVRRPEQYGSMADALHETARLYRRNLWGDLDDYVQVWMEKEALAGVAWDVTEDMGVSLWVARGYSSISYLHHAAQHINNALEAGKTAYIYNLGDHDPSGCDAWQSAVDELRGFATDPGRVRFERVAVTPKQIRRMDLPSRPTKQTDSRSEGFEGESVELDAIPPNALRSIIRDTIASHIPDHVRTMHEQVEARERETLMQLQDYL
ncbi:MAG: hypothetical protein PPP56_02185 [Longimonas sp.]|uniref:hypothetical protein n=1 Tax=Longimonas sp. TaxID=2039626 RepID=UPI00335BEEBD